MCFTTRINPSGMGDVANKSPGQFRGFVPGVSGNPNGRPRVNAKLRDAARRMTDRALQVLAEGMEATKTIVVGKGADATSFEVIDHPTRLYAANSVLDRGYGKPTTDIVISKEEAHEVHELSDEQLIAIAMGKEVEEGSADKPA